MVIGNNISFCICIDMMVETNLCTKLIYGFQIINTYRLKTFIHVLLYLFKFRLFISFQRSFQFIVYSEVRNKKITFDVYNHWVDNVQHLSSLWYQIPIMIKNICISRTNIYIYIYIYIFMGKLPSHINKPHSVKGVWEVGFLQVK